MQSPAPETHQRVVRLGAKLQHGRAHSITGHPKAGLPTLWKKETDNGVSFLSDTVQAGLRRVHKQPSGFSALPS